MRCWSGRGWFELLWPVVCALAAVMSEPHRIKLSDEDEDFWVVQARRANVLLDSPGFSAVIVASNGTMARMNTVHPATFVAFKRWLANQTDREALKRRRDELQADAVQALVEYLPQV